MGRGPAVLDSIALQRALARLDEVVRAKGPKNSEIRDAVARAALEYDCHFAVDDLVKALRESGVAEAHQATVYRVVPPLVEADLSQAKLVSAGDGHRYERTHIRTAWNKVVECKFEDIAERLGFSAVRGTSTSCSASARRGAVNCSRRFLRSAVSPLVRRAPRHRVPVAAPGLDPRSGTTFPLRVQAL